MCYLLNCSIYFTVKKLNYLNEKCCDFLNLILYLCTYEGLSKSSFLFLIQRNVRILSKFYDVHIEVKYVSSNFDAV